MTPPPAPMSPSGPPPPAKKRNVLLWVLVGVGGFFFLIVAGVLAGGIFVAHKIRQNNFEFKSADGRVQIGGDAKAPTWVPDYPGSHPQNAFSAQGREGRSGTFMFKTADSVDHVTKYYRDQLEASGLSLTAVVNSGASQVLTAEDRAKHHSLTVMASGRGNETSVNVTYANK
jgi:hypothetical protein